MNIRGLTLIRPWPWAIFKAGKDVENRSWLPSPTRLQPGEWIAIHAGAKWDELDADWIQETFGLDFPSKAQHQSGLIVGLVRFSGFCTKSDSLWFFGPYGWQWDRMIELAEPIPHKGALGLWTLNMDAYWLCKEAIVKGGAQ